MESELIVQDCGRISLPEDLAERLGVGPGARFAVGVDEGSKSLKLTVVERQGQGWSERAACPTGR